jgi:hypothetical protein
VGKEGWVLKGRPFAEPCPIGGTVRQGSLFPRCGAWAKAGRDRRRRLLDQPHRPGAFPAARRLLDLWHLQKPLSEALAWEEEEERELARGGSGASCGWAEGLGELEALKLQGLVG